MIKTKFTSNDIPYRDKSGWDDDLDAYNLSPIRSLYPILRDGIYHRCSLRSCLSILSDEQVKANQGQYKFTYPQSENNHGHINGWICLFDFKQDPFHIYIAHDSWNHFFNQFRPITAILKLNRKKLDKIIPNKYHNSDKHRGIMCIPYVEAWYPKPIHISAIEKYIIVFTNKNPVDFFIVSKQELERPFHNKMVSQIPQNLGNNKYVSNFYHILRKRNPSEL